MCVRTPYSFCSGRTIYLGVCAPVALGDVMRYLHYFNLLTSLFCALRDEWSGSVCTVQQYGSSRARLGYSRDAALLQAINYVAVGVGRSTKKHRV